MPTGLETYDASGNVVFSATEKYTRVLGIITVTSAGSLSNAMLATGVPFACVTIVGTAGYNGVAFNVSFSGTTMTWSVPSSPHPGQVVMQTTIVYGVN